MNLKKDLYQEYLKNSKASKTNESIFQMDKICELTVYQKSIQLADNNMVRCSNHWLLGEHQLKPQ